MRISSIRAAGAALLAGLAVTAPPAAAATVNTQFNVSLTVLSACVVGATPMLFGSLAIVGAPGLATSVVTVTCTAGTTFTIGLDTGAAPDATIATRFLRGPQPATTTSVPYTLYRDAGRTLLWGNTPETVVNAGAATGLPQPFNVYGRILAGQGAAAGEYLDTVGVVVTYP